MDIGVAIMVLATAGVGTAIHILVRRTDKGRIEAAAHEQGWRQVQIAWAPFAAGWGGKKGTRHYRVTYRDEDGRERERVCKTSMRGGVHWVD
jgi:hypothetical protein